MRLRKEVIRDARSQRSRHGFWERRLARNPPSSSAFLHIDVAASLEKAPNTAPGQEAQETLQSQVEDPQCTTTNARTLRGTPRGRNLCTSVVPLFRGIVTDGFILC